MKILNFIYRFFTGECMDCQSRSNCIDFGCQRKKRTQGMVDEVLKKKDQHKLPGHTTFAICSHNGLWSTNQDKEEKVTTIEHFGGVAKYLDHDNEGYEEDELEVEY